MIPDFKTYLKESLWADVQGQAAGSSVKKEDDVNRLDLGGMYRYLLSHYETKDSEYCNILISFNQRTIEVPVYFRGTSDYVRLTMGEQKYVSISHSMPYQVTGLVQKLRKQFLIVIRHEDTFIISPKDGSEVTNQFFLDVIDFLTENIPEEKYRGVKKITESLWADIQSQASGDVIKKEDEVNNMGIDKLVEYLNQRYKINYSKAYGEEIGKGENANDKTGYLYVPLYVNSNHGFTYMFMDHEPEMKVTIETDIEKLRPNLFEKLQEKYHLVNDNYQTAAIDLYVINPRMNDRNIISADNEFFIEVLDFIIDNNTEPGLIVERIPMNESLWAEIQNQASGETDKKEDENIDLLDIVEVYKLVKDDLPYDYFIDLYDNNEGTYSEDEGAWGPEHKGRRLKVTVGDYECGFEIIYRREKEETSLLVVVNDDGWKLYHKLMDIIQPTKQFTTKTIKDSKDFYVYPKGKKTPNNRTFFDFMKLITEKY